MNDTIQFSKYAMNYRLIGFLTKADHIVGIAPIGPRLINGTNEYIFSFYCCREDMAYLEIHRSLTNFSRHLKKEELITTFDDAIVECDSIRIDYDDEQFYIYNLLFDGLNKARLYINVGE